jgi:hypothetical protein
VFVGRSVRRSPRMRVMARDAVESAVALFEAGRLHQTYGLVADEIGIVDPDCTRGYHCGQTVAASAELKLFICRKAAGAKRHLENSPGFSTTGCVNMCACWPVTALTGDVWNHGGQVEYLVASVGGDRRVTPKAIQGILYRVNPAAVRVARGMSGKR